MSQGLGAIAKDNHGLKDYTEEECGLGRWRDLFIRGLLRPIPLVKHASKLFVIYGATSLVLGFASGQPAAKILRFRRVLGGGKRLGSEQAAPKSKLELE